MSFFVLIGRMEGIGSSAIQGMDALCNSSSKESCDAVQVGCQILKLVQHFHLEETIVTFPTQWVLLEKISSFWH